MPRLSEEKKAFYFQEIRRLMLDEDLRIPYRRIAKSLNIYNKTVSSLYREAVQKQILFPPILRPRICTDYREYVYCINGENIQTLFERLKKDPRVEYIAMCLGHFDLLIIANERIDLTIEDEFNGAVICGERENYIYPEVKKGDYLDVFKKAYDFLDKKDFQFSRIRFDIGKRGNEWLETEKELFRYLKNDGRKVFINIQRKIDISRVFLLECYSRVRKHTFVTVPYYPEGFSRYTKFYVVLKTPYEQQAVELLGSFPCFSAFFKVKDHLFGYVGVELDLIHEFLLLMSDMVSTGFSKSLIFSVPLHYYSRD